MGDHFGAEIRRFRLRAGLTQEALAERSGVSVSTIRGLETGRRRNPQFASVRQLSAALDLEPAEVDELLAAAAGAAEQSAIPVPRQLPACPSGFVGRGDALRLLDAREGRVDGAAPDIRVIAGMAGVGKSWLALRWAHQYLERFPDGQLYVNLRGYDPVELALASQTVLRGFLESLGVPAQEIPYDENACAGLYRSLVAGRRLLIILDNARDTAHVTPLLPGGPACTVLVTSRHRLAGLAVENGASALPLDMLSREEARGLLAYRLGTRTVDAEPEAVESLLDHCAGLPLALGIAAARAAGQSDRPLAALAEELSEAVSRLDALESGEPAIGLRVVLETSYRALDSGNVHAFALLGLIPGPDISLLAAASLMALSLADARVVLRRLESASLVSCHHQDRYRMHDLIHLFAAECGAQDLSEDARKAALHRLFGFYLYTSHAAAALLHPHRATVSLPSLPPGCVPDSPTDSPAAQAWMRAERACLIAAQVEALTQCQHTVVWQLAWALDPFLQRQGACRENVASWRRALAAADRIAVPEIRGLAHQRAGQALAYAGDHSAAVTELTRALELFEQLEDVDGRMRTHRGLAIAWEQQGCHAEALTHLERALSLIDDDTLTRGHVLNAMGWCQAHLGDFTRAQEHCTQALALVDRHDDHHGAAIVRDSLGYIAHRTGRHEVALTHYRAALGLFRGVGDSRQEVAVLRDIGDVHEALHEYEKARRAWTKALDLCRAQQRGAMASLQQRLEALTGHLD